MRKHVGQRHECEHGEWWSCSKQSAFARKFKLCGDLAEIGASRIVEESVGDWAGSARIASSDRVE
jgi:hypothetical protein